MDEPLVLPPGGDPVQISVPDSTGKNELAWRRAEYDLYVVGELVYTDQLEILRRHCFCYQLIPENEILPTGWNRYWWSLDERVEQHA